MSEYDMRDDLVQYTTGEGAPDLPMQPDHAETIASMLELNPHVCVQVKGGVGALPHIRYDHDRWEVATWAGGGLFMGFYDDHDREDIVDTIRHGPAAIPKPVEELDIWEIYDGSVPEDMMLFGVFCDCGASTIREYETGAETWAEEHAEECDEADDLAVETVSEGTRAVPREDSP